MTNLKQKKVIIYPYSFEFTPILRYYLQDLGYDEVVLVSPKSWSLTDKDAASADGGIPINIVVNDTITAEHIHDRDTTIIIPEFKNDLISNKVENVICNALENGLEVICLNEFNTTVIDNWKKYRKFKYYCEHEILDCDKNISLEKKAITSIPIIGICGLVNNINKFDVQIMLNRFLSRKGIRISNITSKRFGKYLNYHTIPYKILIAEGDYEVKINIIKQYIEEIINVEKPEVIIVELPGGIMPYDDYITNNFGYLHSIFFNALSFDYICLNIPFCTPSKAYINELKMIMRYRYNTPLDAVCMSNRSIDKNTISLFGYPDWNIFDFSYIEEKLEVLNKEINIYNALNVLDVEKIGERIIEKLS